MSAARQGHAYPVGSVDGRRGQHRDQLEGCVDHFGTRWCGERTKQIVARHLRAGENCRAIAGLLFRSKIGLQRADERNAPRQANAGQCEQALGSNRGTANCQGATERSVAYLSVLAQRDRPLADRVAASLARTRVAVGAVPPPFRIALRAATALVEAAYAESLTLYRLISVEVTAALGGTLLFTANDGD